MDALAPITFPPAADAAEDAALNEIDVAIALVSAGAAVRVRVAGIAAVMADRLEEVAAARSSAARVRFQAEHGPEAVTFTVGPRLRVVGSD